METNSILDIKVTDSPLQRPFSVQPATIYIEGLPPYLAPVVSAMNRRFGQDADSRGQLPVYRVVSLNANYNGVSDMRLTAMVENPFTLEPLWLEADTDLLEFTRAIDSVIAEADRLMHDFYTDRMVDAVFDNPDGFLEVVSKMFASARTRLHDLGAKDVSQSGEWVGPTLQSSERCLNFIVSPSSDKTDDEDFDIAPGAIPADYDGALPCPTQAPGIEGPEEKLTRSAKRKKSSEKDKLSASKNLSARERHDLILDIPKNISKGYLENNRKSHAMVKELFSTFTPEEVFEIVSRMNLLSKVASGLMDNSCNYDIVVRPVRKGDPSRFRGKLGYNLYLRDSKGREHVVEFKYTAAHCMYMLHVLNRKQHGGDTIDLDLPKFEKEFRKLYEFLFSSDAATADHNFRSTSKETYEDIDGKKKNGRFKEYIQDIHTGLCKIAGDGDSVPLKIAEGRPLALAPDQIHVSEDFNIFKINYA